MNQKEEFVKMIKEYETLLYKITRAYVATPEEHEDLFQEVVFQAWKAFPSFKRQSKVSTWLYRIGLNVALTHSRSKKRQPKYTMLNPEVSNSSFGDDENLKLRMERLYEQINRLLPVERGIILMHLDGYNYEEISAVTGFTTSNVGTRLNRIKTKLKKQLNKN